MGNGEIRLKKRLEIVIVMQVDDRQHEQKKHSLNLMFPIFQVGRFNTRPPRKPAVGWHAGEYFIARHSLSVVFFGVVFWVFV
jgi:hypothetical protein